MRSFGTVISGNRRPKADLSPEIRAAILQGLEQKQSPTELSRTFSVSRSTNYHTRNNFATRQNFKTKPRNGRPRKLSPSDERYIYLLARRKPQLTWRGLFANTSLQVSKSTLRRVLKKYNLRKWKSKQRIPLTKEDAKNRLQFARTWANFDGWGDVIFSDECSVQRKPNNSVQYVFRFSNEAYRRDLVNLVNQGKDISQMIWGAIWVNGRSKLVIMERGEASRRQGYSTISYLECLQESLLPVYEPGRIFQQDNARIHVSRQAQEWFEGHGIWVLDWPPHSPDLNPIEHLWNLLKKKLVELYPDLFLGGRSKMDWTQFKVAIQAAWDAIPQDVINRLIESMPRRLEAVIASRGWYTKY